MQRTIKYILSLTLLLTFLAIYIYTQQSKKTDDFYAENITYQDKGQNDYQMYFHRSFQDESFKELTTTLETLDYLRSFIIIQNEKLIFEGYFNNTKITDANNIHSASKSILSVLTGIAIQEGYLNPPPLVEVGDSLFYKEVC